MDLFLKNLHERLLTSEADTMYKAGYFVPRDYYYGRDEARSGRTGHLVKLNPKLVTGVK